MNKLTTLIVSLILISFLFPGCQTENKKTGQDNVPEKDITLILEDWCKSFINKTDSNYLATVNFTVSDNNRSHHIMIDGNGYSISEGMNEDANFSFRSSLEHYNMIYRGDITAFTSMGRENMSDTTPLDADFHRAVTGNLMNDILFFVQRFFNTSPHDKVVLAKENSRIVHGGHAIPVFYRTSDEIGVRSAWYQVNKGQQVNEPGDTNPFPQYFIIMRGNGFARIGNDTLVVKENEAYYIEPGSDHVFWTESDEPMEMIFLAWGEGA
ncbi:MAG: cupin domain-containing protein [Bacteroidota bacterium]